MTESKIAKHVKLIDIDAYSPPQIADKIDKIALVKAKLGIAQTFALGFWQGFISGLVHNSPL